MAAIREVNYLWFPLFILLSILTISQSQDSNCTYTIYVKTGTRINAETNSSISLRVFDKEGKSNTLISNLEELGRLMGKVTTTSSRETWTPSAEGLTGPVCGMDLISNGTNKLPAWFVEYVNVIYVNKELKCSWFWFRFYDWVQADRGKSLIIRKRSTRGNCSR